MKLNLSAKLVLGGTLLVAVPLLLVSGYGIFSTARTSKENSNSELQSAASETAKAVQMLIESQVQIPIALSNSDTVQTACRLYDQQALDEATLKETNLALHRILVGLGPRYEGVFLANTRGRVFGGVIQSGETSVYRQLDIRDRSYYQAAMATKKPLVGQPVKSKVAGDPITVLFVPVSQGEKVIGFIGLSLKVQYIIDWIAARRVGTAGYAFLLDQKGTFLAFPEKELVLTQTASAIPEMKQISEQMVSGRAGLGGYLWKGSPLVAAYAPVPNLGWSAAAVQPRSELMAPIYAMAKQWLIIGLGAVVVAGLACAWVGRTLSHPILHAVEFLERSADEVSTAATSVSESSQSVASMTTEQAAALQETSSSLEELSSMAQQNADSAHHASNAMSQNKQTVDKADAALREVAAAMKVVCAASEESQKIVKTMDEFAFQTNILALNAAVEAARAGAAGAGFAVVSEEVRSLASRSAEAARHTAAIIEENIRKIRAGDALVQLAAEEFGRVSATSAEIERMLAGIARASAEQTQGVHQINTAVTQQDQAVQANAAAAEESASASTELTGQASAMRGQLAVLSTLVRGKSTNKDTPARNVSAPDERAIASKTLPTKSLVRVLTALLILFTLPRKSAVAADANIDALDARLGRVEELLGLMASNLNTTPEKQKEVSAAVQQLRTQVDAARLSAAPRSSAEKTTFRFYGYAKLDTSYDSQKTSNGDLMFFVLPKENGRADNEFNMTVRESRLGLAVERPNANGAGKTEGRLEMDFNGGGTPNSLTPRLRLAYADFALGDWSVRVGQDWDAFITVIPRSLNFAVFGDQGQLGNRRPQVRLIRKWNEVEVRVAAARTIGQDLDGYGQDDGVDSGVPTVEWNVLWSRATPRGTFKASVSGHYGIESVEQPILATHCDYASWSVIGSVVAPISKHVQLQGTLWEGSNLDTYCGGIGQGITLPLRRAIDAKGGWIQALITCAPQWVFHTTVGLDDPDDDDLAPAARSLNRVVSGGAWYEFRPSMKVALELSQLKTSYKSAPAASNTRVQSGLIMEF